jgi:hypothetical protein
MQFCFVVQAQNLNEWVRQKKTQIRYLVEQVAALQVYIELGQQGYAIYRDGLEVIGDIEDGEFNLHKDYFASLSAVNPHVSGSHEVEEIMLWNKQVQIFRQRIDRLDVGSATASGRQLFATLAQKSTDHAAQVQLLIADGNYQLKDEERFEQIAGVHRQMRQLYGFAKQTYQDAILQSKVLPKQDKEIEIIEQLHGLP